HGLTVTNSYSTLSGGTNSTTERLDDSGFTFTDTTNGQTFGVTNSAVGTLGNASLAGKLTVLGGATTASDITLDGTTGRTTSRYLTVDTNGTGVADGTVVTVDDGAVAINNGTFNVDTDTTAGTAGSLLSMSNGSASLKSESAGGSELNLLNTSAVLSGANGVSTVTLNSTGAAITGGVNTIGTSSTTSNTITAGTNTFVVDDTTIKGTSGSYSSTVSSTSGQATLSDGTYTVGIDTNQKLGGSSSGDTVASLTDGTRAVYVDNSASSAGLTTNLTTPTANNTANITVANVGGSAPVATVQVIDATGDAHGLVVTDSSSTLSGGTRSSTWTLADGSSQLTVAGATSGTAKELILATTDTNSNNPQVRLGDISSTTLTVNNTGVHLDNNGNPVPLTGVADGVNNYDAVNVEQLNRVSKKAYSGIAQVAAMATIPAPMPGHQYSIGMGAGTYGGQQAFAIGGKAIVTDNVTLGASFGVGSGSPTAAAVGASFSW
ncbi:MAG TPA: YadA C-terminal domain-containing protein, partial [Chlorobaculum sp.]|nr:YadA C-terminal domain-containing protein [Chlorobaculum sp.]